MGGASAHVPEIGERLSFGGDSSTFECINKRHRSDVTVVRITFRTGPPRAVTSTVQGLLEIKDTHHPRVPQ